jgi:hypothetical protein
VSYPFAHELDVVRVVPDTVLDFGLFVRINMYEAVGRWDALGTSVLLSPPALVLSKPFGLYRLRPSPQSDLFRRGRQALATHNQ